MKFEKISKRQYMKDFVGKFPCPYTDIKLPKRGTAQSAGYDIFSPIDFTLHPGESIKLPTGIKFKCDADKWLMCVPRSGQGFKYGIMLANTVGVIDADYYNNPNNEGHMWVKLTYPQQASINIDPFVVKAGDAICQAIIVPYFTVEDDDTTTERVGGFGSTSNNEPSCSNGECYSKELQQCCGPCRSEGINVTS